MTDQCQRKNMAQAVIGELLATAVGDVAPYFFTGVEISVLPGQSPHRQLEDSVKDGVKKGTRFTDIPENGISLERAVFVNPEQRFMCTPVFGGADLIVIGMPDKKPNSVVIHVH